MSTIEKQLAAGTVVHNWKILAALGSGSFGAVYRVVKKTDSAPIEECAMKLQPVDADAKMINMEIAILKSNRNQLIPYSHLCAYFDSGDTGLFRYLVMQILGPSLAGLLSACPSNRFSPSTATRLALQALECVESIHRLGFLHRDLKPANFAMGVSDKKRILYVFDYGLARRYLNSDGKMFEPRPALKFRGTIMYASVNSHEENDLGRRDDLWSLLYSIVEFHLGHLPWRNDVDERQVYMSKKSILPNALLQNMDNEYFEFLADIQRLEFQSVPNYALYFQLLRSIIMRNKWTDDTPYDWEEGGIAHKSITESPPDDNPYG